MSTAGPDPDSTETTRPPSAGARSLGPGRLARRAYRLLLALAVAGLFGGAVPAGAAAGTTITVSSVAGTVAAGSGCTLRDALTLANETSNPALSGQAGAGTDCSGQVSGSGSPYTIVLQAGQTYTLDSVDNYWFGPDALPPISADVNIDGQDATIARSSAGGTPACPPLLRLRRTERHSERIAHALGPDHQQRPRPGRRQLPRRWRCRDGRRDLRSGNA